MYSQGLETLIDAALTDGELTEKEKQILFKKAQGLGIDLDEFEMILDSRLQKKQQELKMQNVPKSSAPSSSKFGDVRKCPSCGTVLESFVTRCPECGHEFTNVNAVASAQKLFDLLNAAAMRSTSQIQENEKERQRQLNELSARQNAQSGFSKLITSKEDRESERQAIMKAMDEARLQIEGNLVKERQSIIKNFPVPNTKEDLTELLSMATSNAYDNDGVIGPEEEVWIQKCDQIYTKIKAIAGKEKDTQFLDMASEMIVSLISRLPKAYKNFTKIDNRAAEKLQLANNATKEQKRKRAINVMKIWGPVTLLAWIFFFFCLKEFFSSASGTTLLLGIVSVIILIVVGVIRRKKMREEGIGWTDIF